MITNIQALDITVKSEIMVTMNSVIKVEMTVMEATLLRSTCFIAAYELIENDPMSAKHLRELEEKIRSTLDNLDYSENELLVDKTNAKIAK